MGRLEGRVAVVIGAGSGIGKATATRFAEEGAKVVCADITGREKEVAEELRVGGLEAVSAYADTSKTADVQSLLQTTVRQHGRVDVLVNSAAYRLERANFVDIPDEYFDNVIAVNLRGVFLAMKYSIPIMIENGRGSIINMASVTGLRGAPRAGAYAASKGGLIQLTRTAAREYASQNVRVNAICPGVIETPRILNAPIPEEERQRFVEHVPMGRMGWAEEVAAMAVFLASEESSFVTGAVLPVDGGSSA